MTRLHVPQDTELWPTLGPEICDWIEAGLVHGPGDILGEPANLTDEVRGFIYRCYEVFPRGHPIAGRRRFKRVVLSRRKGWSKTEVAAWITIAEADPTAPVRCDGWHKVDGVWVPVGRPVHDPYIPMIAVTEEQTEDLAYGAVYAILDHAQLDYDVGLDRIKHRTAPGQIKPLAGAPSARDGALTSFQHFDETHLFLSERLKRAHGTMIRNLAKRKEADPWALETTTAFGPGENSVAEGSHQYALAVMAGKVADPRLLFDHLQADESRAINTKRGLLAALKEASGDAYEFSDIDAIAAQFHDPQVSDNDRRRYWLNQPRKSANRWLDIGLFESRADPKRLVPKGSRVVLGFDGSYSRDSTALVACTVEERPHIQLLNVWEKPFGAPPQWRTPRAEVMSAVDVAMEDFEVVELAPDPPGWVIEVEEWEQTYGEVVVRFDTAQPSRMGPACDDFEQAVRDGRLTHDGSEVLRRHVGNCIAKNRRGQIIVTKSADDSPDKIDSAIAAIVAHHRAMWRFTHPEAAEEDLGALLINTRGEEVEGTCPACRIDGQLRTAGRRIRCGACGHTWLPEEAAE